MITVRDVIQATAKAGAVSVELLLSRSQAQELTCLRQAGLLVSSRITAKPWSIIGRAWGKRDRRTVETTADKGAARYDQADEYVVFLVKEILKILGEHKLPPHRPANTGRSRTRETVCAQIAIHKARIRNLKAQLRALDGAA